MNRRVALAASLPLLLAAGCMDPSIYRGPGASGIPSSTPSGSPASERAAGAAQGRAGQGEIRIAPTRTAGEARKGDIRIFPAAPTVPTTSPDNVAIIVQKLGADESTLTQAGVAFQYAHGDVTVAGGEPLARRNGLRVGVAGPNFRGGVGASHGHTRSSTTEQMFVVCQSGTEGQIVVGEDVFVQSLGYWTPTGYHVLVERAFVGRALAVRPVILPGGRVQVTLWPRFTTRSRRGAIDVTELATTVVVRDGQPIALGGLTTGGEEVGAVLFGVGRERRTSTMTLLLTPKIGGMAIDWPKGMP